MPTHRWARRGLLAVVWAGAASTWGSIAHHFAGFPDVGPALVLGACFATIVVPVIRERSQQRRVARTHRTPGAAPT